MTAAKTRKRATKSESPPVEPKKVITSYKGFDMDFACHPSGGERVQYEIGKTLTMDGDIVACRRGFHACEHPLDVLKYYPAATSRFAEVEQSGKLSRHDEDTKIASAEITVKVELKLSDLIARAVKWVFDRSHPEGGASATGDRGAASATGDRGAASATGHSGAASATGHSGAASATGHSGAASATGYRGAASATGHSGAASATGYRGAASATGDSGAASATGDSGAASATGHRGAASATGHSGIAIAAGCEGRAMAAEGGAICLVNRDLYSGEIVAIRASKVGENGIEPGVFYLLNAVGEFVRA